MNHLGNICKINGAGSCRWASEIEPYAVAVTEFRFEVNQNNPHSERKLGEKE